MINGISYLTKIYNKNIMKNFSVIIMLIVVFVMSCATSVAQDLISDPDSTTIEYMIPDRPGLGDSPNLVAPGHLQFEGSYNFNEFKGFYTIARFSPIKQWEIRAIYTDLFKTGVVDNIQVLIIGSKIKIADQKGNVPTMALVVYMDKNYYNHINDEEIGTLGFTYRGVLSAQHTFFQDKIALGGNVGLKYLFNENEKFYTPHFVWSAIGLYFVNKFTITAEVYNPHYSFTGSFWCRLLYFTKSTSGFISNARK